MMLGLDLLVMLFAVGLFFLPLGEESRARRPHGGGGRVRRAIAVLLVAAVPGCSLGGDDEPERSARPERPSPRGQSGAPRPGEPPEARTIRAWSSAVNAERLRGRGVVLRARRDRGAGAGVPAARPEGGDRLQPQPALQGRVTDVEDEGDTVLAAFRLRDGPGGRLRRRQRARAVPVQGGQVHASGGSCRSRRGRRGRRRRGCWALVAGCRLPVLGFVGSGAPGAPVCRPTAGTEGASWCGCCHVRIRSDTSAEGAAYFLDFWSLSDQKSSRIVGGASERRARRPAAYYRRGGGMRSVDLRQLFPLHSARRLSSLASVARVRA